MHYMINYSKCYLDDISSPSSSSSLLSPSSLSPSFHNDFSLPLLIHDLILTYSLEMFQILLSYFAL